MGKQYNKVVKRKRRLAYLQRKVAAQAVAVKPKTSSVAPKAAKKASKAEPTAPKAPKAPKAKTAAKTPPTDEAPSSIVEPLVAAESTPVIEQTALAAEQTAPAAEDSTPAAEDSTPAANI